MKRIFTVAEQEAMVFPFSAISDDLLDQTRWGVLRKAVVEHDGKYWELIYERPSGDGDWDAYQRDIEATEVQKMQVTVDKWMPVE